jgi:beta-galactosidase
MTEENTFVKKPNRLHIGAAYYPEHWTEDRWIEDVKLMKEAGFTVVRMAEFAWSTMEPQENEFKVDWLDRVITLLAENNIDTVLGTPSAAPPAWLTQKYPETLAIDEFDRPVQHGNRCHYCVNSPEYHQAVRKIIHKMAEQFGSIPNVIGWQLDNEYSRVCYCGRCRTKFQEYLKERYESLDILNTRWSAAYWSQTYSNWEQIPIPIGPHNPSLMLEFKRFVTESYRKFQNIQLKELRPFLPIGVWVTHNFMGWFDGFDHYVMSEDLDMPSWDYYIGTGHHDYLAQSATHSLTRGFKQKNYWVMETQPGTVNWSSVNNMLHKGEARAMAWQGVAHGADGILYWQWRSALGGQEQYHGTLVDQSGQPRPFYGEVKQLGEEFEKVTALLEGTEPKARVAILFDYESRWAVQWQKHHQEFDYVAFLNHFYQPFVKRNVAVDIISAKGINNADQLVKYRLVIAPALNILSQKLAGLMEQAVKRGMHLVLTLRTGMKDEFNALLPIRQPGYTSSIAGIEVEEFYALDENAPIKANLFEGFTHTWAEQLKITGQYALKMGSYKKSNGWLDDKPAMSITGVLGGSGMVYYIGAYLDDNSQQILIDRFLKNVNIEPLTTPRNVEVRTRVNQENKEIYFIINHANNPATLWLPWLAKNHLTDSLIEDELTLDPYGVAIVTREEEQ